VRHLVKYAEPSRTNFYASFDEEPEGDGITLGQALIMYIVAAYIGVLLATGGAL
jgi:hypothetical protein